MGHYISFKSPPRRNPLALEWEYHMIEDRIEGIDFNHLAKVILSKEKELIKTLPVCVNKDSMDGYTGLGPNSLTSRYDSYNVLNWEDPECEKLKDAILKMHDQFLKILRVDRPNRIFCQCWANVLRKGEKMNPHLHGVDPDAYIGGHITVQCEDTQTIYINPPDQLNIKEEWKSTNIPGKITLFQQCIPHYTTEHKGDKERITLAFDLITDNHSWFFQDKPPLTANWVMLSEYPNFLVGTK